MAKRDTTTSYRKRVKPVRSVSKAPETVRVRLLQEVNTNVIGPVTSTVYVFSGAGSVCHVDRRDLPKFIKKTSGGGCCTGAGESPYFEVLD